MANPDMPMLSADFASGFTLAGAFIDDVVGGVRAADARVLGYDIMNEPSRTTPFEGGLAAFITWALNRTAVASRGALTTVDAYAGVPADLTRQEAALSYHSYYHYSHWRDCGANTTDVRAMQSQAAAAQLAAAAKLDKPVVLSEFGQSDCYCPAAEAVQAAGVGWFAWELINDHDQFGAFQGLLFANGTARSEKEVACVRQLAAAGVEE